MPIVVLSASRDVSRPARTLPHAMPDHERDCGPLLLGKRQVLRRKLARRC